MSRVLYADFVVSAPSTAAAGSARLALQKGSCTVLEPVTARP